MFDDRSFSSSSFDGRSWFGIGEITERFVEYLHTIARRFVRR